MQSFEKSIPAAPVPRNAAKGFPVFGILALVILNLMLLVFVVNMLLMTGNSDFLIPRMAGRNSMGMDSLARLAASGNLWESVTVSFGFRVLELAGCAIVAAGFCALYYAMRKPGTALTFACLWLIPACVPYYPIMTGVMRALGLRGHEALSFLLVNLLQTVSVFCFAGGLFTFLRLRKTGSAGAAPYFGLLVASLCHMLNMLNTSSVSRGSYRTMDRFIENYVMRYDLDLSGASSFIKLVLQFLFAIVPFIILCILARRKSTKGKTPLMVLWVFLAGLTAAVAGMLIPSVTRVDPYGLVPSLLIAVAGGAVGGLIAYSFILLMRRSPALLFGLVALILALSMTCQGAQFALLRNLGMMNTVLPSVLLAAFDMRLVLLATILAFALRDYTERRPGSLVLAVALFCAAFAWGAIGTDVFYGARSVIMNYAQVVESARYPGAVTVQGLLAIIPPVLMGAGAALLLRRSLKEPA